MVEIFFGSSFFPKSRKFWQVRGKIGHSNHDSQAKLFSLGVSQFVPPLHKAISLLPIIFRGKKIKLLGKTYQALPELVPACFLL